MKKEAGRLDESHQNPALFYEGRLRELLPLVLLNSMLSLITLGIYRFWGKTNIRRYLWSRMSLLGQPLEYSGTGMELFVGFLIIVCILVPIGFCSFLLPIILLGYGITFGPVLAQGFLGLLFFYLSHIAVYRAQRYRLSRTSWRGICSELKGSSVTYANQATLCTFLMFMSLGLAYPYMQVKLLKYRIENAAFGGVSFEFGANVRTLMHAWMICLSTTIILALLIYTVVEPHVSEVFASLSQDIQHIHSLEFLRYLLIPLIFFCLLPITTVWYKAVSIRHFCSSIKFEDMSAQSNLTTWNIIQIYLPLFFCMIFGSLVLLMVALFMSNELAHQAYTIIIFTAFYLFMPIILMHRHLTKIFDSLSLSGSFSPEKLFQSQQVKPKSGEGLADALNLDAF